MRWLDVVNHQPLWSGAESLRGAAWTGSRAVHPLWGKVAMPEEKWVPRDKLPNGILAEGWEALPDGTKYTWTVPGNQAKQKAAMEDRELWDMLIQEKMVEAKAFAKQQVSAARVKENMSRLIKLEDAFSHFDADGSGALDNEEVMKILMRVGPEDTNPNAMTEDDAKEFIDLFDRDGSGKMEIKEFIEAMKAIAGLEGLDVKEDTEVVADILVEGGMSTELEHNNVKEKLKEHVENRHGLGFGQIAT